MVMDLYRVSNDCGVHKKEKHHFLKNNLCYQLQYCFFRKFTLRWGKEWWPLWPLMQVVLSMALVVTLSTDGVGPLGGTTYSMTGDGMP